MSEKKRHYYIDCEAHASTVINDERTAGNWLFITQTALVIFGRLANRLGDLVLAMEEQTQAIISPDRIGLKF